MPVICCSKKQGALPPPIVEMDNFWISKGTNYLKGCCNNPDHPIKLADCFILRALQTIDRARRDFCRLYPALLPCEKERFETLMEQFPGLFKPHAEQLLVEDVKMADRIRKLPIHTVGPQGALNQPIMCNKPMVQYNSGK